MKKISKDLITTEDVEKKIYKDRGKKHNIGSEGICPYCKHRKICLGSSFGPHNLEILTHPFARMGCEHNIIFKPLLDQVETYKKVLVEFEYDPIGYKEYWKEE